MPGSHCYSRGDSDGRRRADRVGRGTMKRARATSWAQNTMRAWVLASAATRPGESRGPFLLFLPSLQTDGPRFPRARLLRGQPRLLSDLLHFSFRPAAMTNLPRVARNAAMMPCARIPEPLERPGDPARALVNSERGKLAHRTLKPFSNHRNRPAALSLLARARRKRALVAGNGPRGLLDAASCTLFDRAPAAVKFIARDEIAVFNRAEDARQGNVYTAKCYP